MCIAVLHTYVYALSACPGAIGSQKGAADPLELKLQMVVSYHVSAGIETWVPCKNSSALNC